MNNIIKLFTYHSVTLLILFKIRYTSKLNMADIHKSFCRKMALHVKEPFFWSSISVCEFLLAYKSSAFCSSSEK